jgi:integrase
LGCFFGLRISDILSLRWEDIYEKEEFELIEKKTSKKRHIKINPQLRRHIADCHESIKPRSISDFIFTSQKGTVYSIQRINVVLKEMKLTYNLKIQNFSSHSLRKCFGRTIFERSEGNAELAIVKLSQLYNHSSSAITRRYLGISQKELMDTYDVLTF